MFNWFKKKKKTEEQQKIEPTDQRTEFGGLAVASMRYVVGVDSVIYLEFYWDEDANEDAISIFTDLFSQINNGELLETSVDFIKETLDSEGEGHKFKKFYLPLIELQKSKLQPFMEAFGKQIDKAKDEVVVKPTDLTRETFGGNQS
tara:strand:+ start:3415 stop:3852 length:438 start_codon:yes stop_codon:yes gene_type:complete